MLFALGSPVVTKDARSTIEFWIDITHDAPAVLTKTPSMSGFSLNSLRVNVFTGCLQSCPVLTASRYASNVYGVCNPILLTARS